MSESMLLGLDRKERLFRFFKTKNHKNLILRVVDVLELVQDDQLYLISLLAKLRGSVCTATTANERKRYFLKVFPDGYIKFPLKWLAESVDMLALNRLQCIMFNYVAVRREKGVPFRIDVCEKCNGTGVDSAGKACFYCGGGGKIEIVVEMSDDEIALAEKEI